MSIAYLNDNYLPLKDATVSVEDRGYIFGDGVYEVVAIINGVPINLELHLERLEHSLTHTEMNVEKKSLKLKIKIILQELIARNGSNKTYKLYLQITRGVMPRNHCFQSESMKHSLLMVLYPHEKPELIKTKLKCVLTQDIRWFRKDIKSTSVIANVLLKQMAKNFNTNEAILYKENNIITEGSTCNIFIVNYDNNILTHPANNDILNGVYRRVAIKIAKECNFNIIEKEFTINQLLSAKEVFATNCSFFIAPVLKVDDRLINNAETGDITSKLAEKIYQYIDDKIKNATSKTKSYAF